MIKGIIKYGLIVVIAIVGYNYFAGSPDEKQNAKEIVNKVKGIGVSVKDLIKSEHLKYKDGKYDETLNKMGNLLRKLKDKASDGSEKLIKKLESIDHKRKLIKEKINETGISEEDKNELKDQLKKLVNDANNLADDFE